jgi:outer membrane protein OmpA-like peptidoglycan-associated protein
MLINNKTMQKLSIALMMVVLACTSALGQTAQPTWWFGVSGAANISSYTGTTQTLNNSLVVPAAFHKGNGVRPFGSILMEYRPAGAWGAMLNVGYDGRGGKFDNVVAPCNCEATLETNTSYLTVEPSLRLGLFSTNLFIFAGPRVAFNLQKEFAYTQEKQSNTDGELSDMRKTILSGQAGIGYDFPVSSANSNTKISISPFVSYHPYFGQDPRSIESWSVSTVRAGVALKFGKAKKAVVEAPTAVAPVGDVAFTIVEPNPVRVKRVISETLPLRNSIFFDEGSNAIPSRYVVLSNAQASDFKEQQLQQEQLESGSVRSARQLAVYHNVLNILGDRLRENTSSRIALSGASHNGAAEGKILAENVKQYLVTTFGIDGTRISTTGRTKPLIPSEQPGGQKELVLLREGDRRVDIVSTSPELLMQVGGEMMKPVLITNTQQNPTDGQVLFNVKGAKKQLKSWSLDLTDEKGAIQHFGPFTNEQTALAGNAILNNQPEGTYKVLMTGESLNGLPITKQGSVHLVQPAEAIEKGSRYSILFDFDKASAIAAYAKFLNDDVAPLITDASTVIIRGHTDVIGDEGYNLKLSEGRAQETQKILEHALANSNKSNVKFQTAGYGEEAAQAPFDNNLPEERFYNRTVIIDINPAQ